MDYTDVRDEQLITLVSRGDKAALGTLYDRYARPVYSLALGIMRDQGIAEDVTQDVFLLVWGKASTYRSQRGKFLSWLLRVTHNRAIDELRRQRNHSSPRSMDRVAEIAAQRSNGFAGDPSDTHRADIRSALERLSPVQQQVVTLAYYEGLTQSEIAEKLGMPLGTVKTRMRLALQRLKTALAPLREEQ